MNSARVSLFNSQVRVTGSEEGGHDVTLWRQFVRSDYYPRARIVDASYKNRSMDEVTTDAWCFLLS